MDQTVDYIIETIGLTRSFGRVKALRGLDLQVPHHSVFALLGPNGAGKTTTIRILLNIIRADGGEAQILGHNSTEIVGDKFVDIGYVTEGQILPGWMTIEYLLHYCQNLYTRWDPELSEQLVQRLQLDPKAKLKNLSRGMKL